MIVLDDFAPMTSSPPVYEGQPDEARMYWLDHPRLRAAEVKVTPAAASVVATFVG
ncbi:hypothetical protein ABZ345_39225 [Lentzea sp. NPDC005914]|uniref:hypothetical protein n=1 Tax=Lentzea sp. NPDC005914 TaxID=3154572 RepID=UPI0033D69BD0